MRNIKHIAIVASRDGARRVTEQVKLTFMRLLLQFPHPARDFRCDRRTDLLGLSSEDRSFMVPNVDDFLKTFVEEGNFSVFVLRRIPIGRAEWGWR